MSPALFDSWSDTYDRWFDTPSGRMGKDYESRVLIEMTAPEPGDAILDVGCGTGLFTRDILETDGRVTGVDLSAPMLNMAGQRLGR